MNKVSQNNESFLRREPDELPKSRKSFLLAVRLIGIIFLLIFLFSGVRIIQPGEVGVLLRFGRLPEGPTAVHNPGLMLSFPYPIDEVIRIPVQELKEIVIDGFWQAEGEGQYATTFHPFEQGYAITADYNVIMPKLSIKYKIGDPVAWVLNNEDPNRIILDVIGVELRRAVSEMLVDDLLTIRKAELVLIIKTRSQERLDSLNVGATILTIEVTELIPPRSILPEFQAVQSAYIQKETAIRNAETYESQTIPAARAEANTMENDARAYATTTLAKAKSEVNSFLELLEEYHRNPDVLKERLLMEYLTAAYSQVGTRYVVPDDPVTGRILIPPAE